MRLLAALLALGSVWQAAAQPALRVAAASDLQSALPALTGQFEKDTGLKVTVTFGSSGNFYTQIRNGAPFDVFLSADIEYPRRLEAAGLAERGSLFEYARGKIVLWTRRDSGIDVARGFAALGDSRVRRIAIANPEHAPYGRAAVAALRDAKLYDASQPKFVLGENISQAAQFAQSGGADVGIIALSLALAPALKDSGVYFEIPEQSYPPIQQAAVVVAASRARPEAARFVHALRQPAARRVLQTFGFATP